MKKPFILFLLICYTLMINAQKTDSYITNQLETLKSGKKELKTLNGTIYSHNDTISVSLINFKGKNAKNNWLFCAIINNDDSLTIYYPQDIIAYKIEDAYYVSHYSDGNYFFIKQVKWGNIDLFERYSIPDDPKFVYYLKFKNKDEYFVINPYESNVSMQTVPDMRQSNNAFSSTTHYETKALPEKFKQFIGIYLADCTAIVNKVKAEFYTVSDLPNIIEEYNQCAK